MRKFIAFSMLIALAPSLAFAHGGGLDKKGCHHNRKAGGYHCHRGPLAGQHFRSKREAANALKPSANLSGIPRIIDGDTIQIGSTRIRLFGIDAPEAKQTCTIDGKPWNCGQEATNALANMVGGKAVSCVKTDVDRYGRIVAVCRVAGKDINARMVSLGWAVAYRRYSKNYEYEEVRAKAKELGMWRGEFVVPWKWRRENRTKK